MNVFIIKNNECFCSLQIMNNALQNGWTKKMLNCLYKDKTCFSGTPCFSTLRNFPPRDFDSAIFRQPYYLVLSFKGLSCGWLIHTVVREGQQQVLWSAVHQLFIFWFVSRHCLRSTLRLRYNKDRRNFPYESEQPYIILAIRNRT